MVEIEDTDPDPVSDYRYRATSADVDWPAKSLDSQGLATNEQHLRLNDSATSTDRHLPRHAGIHSAYLGASYPTSAGATWENLLCICWLSF